jgi:hypothetical protein
MAASAFISTMLTLVAGDPAFVTPVAEGDPYATLEAWIALAVVEVHTTRWGNLYVQAVALLAAHKYSMGPGAASAGGASAGGSVAEKRARNWAIRFNASPGGSTLDEGLRQTRYGLEFLRLRAYTRGPAIITPARS